MDLGTCTFSPQQRGRVALAADGKSVTITPAGALGIGWLASVSDERKASAMREASDPMVLQLVQHTNSGADLLRLRAAGTLTLGVDRESGRYCPARLKCYTLDGSMTVAEFATGGK